VTAVEPIPAAHRLRPDRPAEHKTEQGDRDQDDEDGGEAEHRGPQLPNRAPLANLVNTVHCPTEGTNVPAGRPESAGEADDQRGTGGLRAAQVLQRWADAVGHTAGTDGAQHVETWPTASVPRPTRPSSEVSAIAAGNSASTA